MRGHGADTHVRRTMSQLTADLLLLLVTLVWGTTFVIVKQAISAMGPLTFVAVRFFIAGAILIAWHVFRAGRPPVAVRRGAGPASGSGLQAREVCADRLPGTTEPVPPAKTLNAWYNASREFYAGAVLTGLALFFAYATQTLGLVTVASGKAAFITGLYVVMVPIASRAILRAAPDRNSVIGVILATSGLGLMSLKLPLQVAAGDFLVFLCAIGFAAHILLVSRYSEHGDPVLFAGVQLLVVSAGSFICAIIFERPLLVPPGAWGPVLFTALAATSFAFLTQSAVQRYTSATHTALIFSAEPVFGALFAWLMTGEILVAREIAGAVFILTGMLVSESGLFRT